MRCRRLGSAVGPPPARRPARPRDAGISREPIIEPPPGAPSMRISPAWPGATGPSKVRPTARPGSPAAMPAEASYQISMLLRVLLGPSGYVPEEFEPAPRAHCVCQVLPALALELSSSGRLPAAMTTARPFSLRPRAAASQQAWRCGARRSLSPSCGPLIVFRLRLTPRRGAARASATWKTNATASTTSLRF